MLTDIQKQVRKQGHKCDIERAKWKLKLLQERMATEARCAARGTGGTTDHVQGRPAA